ncbi:iron-siderophore ABC transporter substrate-binding protein [filamentous cyanobacterium CCT1]|nr:iron-siderophore ABC transporter substrate-binding protein [filamentous cyanobacterium CCT1]PSN76664.1 iron-siderophore ABC transporter substrate-binding protein [filamentous cyanobacterium CCP4]
MSNQYQRLAKLCLLMVISSILITACSQQVVQTTHFSSQIPSDCRVVQHVFGKTCVPLDPQRIIALDPIFTLDPLIALGVEPIGFASYNGSGEEVLLGVSFDEVEGAKNVGDAGQPSFEKILVLKPDLILTTDYGDDEQKYKLLSKIAPTVSVPNESHLSPEDYENKPWFKENLRFVAKVLGQEAKSEEVLRQYQNRIEALKNRLGNQLHQIEVSVIFYGEGYIWTISKGNYPVSFILDDVGLRYKSVPYGEWNLSIETISEYDSDILFIVDVDKRGASFYLQHPLFRDLEVVKNNRAYVVSQENWRSGGISGANKTLNDLFKYLPEDE